MVDVTITLLLSVVVSQWLTQFPQSQQQPDTICSSIVLPRLQTCRTHHRDVEGVQQVKGQGSHQVHKEPGGGVVDADGSWLVNHLPWLAHEGGAEIQDDVCKWTKNKTK